MVKNMKCSIRGEKIRVTKAIDEYINSKLSRIDKYFKEGSTEAKVLIKLKGKKQAIEVTIPYDKYTLRSEYEHDDLYAAIDLVVDKLEGQIRKNKAKVKKQIKLLKKHQQKNRLQLKPLRQLKPLKPLR